MSEDNNGLVNLSADLAKGLTVEDSKQIGKKVNEDAEKVGKLDVEDLSAVFFNRYGHKLNAIVNEMSAKQIRRAIINAFGFQFDGYNPEPESDEGKLLWAMDRLVEARTTMFLHSLQERSLKEAELEFKKGQTIEDDIIKMEDQRIKETKTEGDTDNGI